MKKLSGHTNKSLQEIYKSIQTYLENNQEDKDFYGNGKSLNEFEVMVAKRCGLEAALFLPSGVMAQLIAIKIWGDMKGSHKFSCHETCHLIRHEEESYKYLLGFEVELIGSQDKVPCMDDLQKLSADVSSLIYELPMRHLGGDLPSFEELENMKNFCKEKNIKFHIDGARLFETQHFYNKDVSKIVSGCDSLFISFYKGFGSTSGSMLLGSESFIQEARIWLRRFGGNLFELYPLVIPAKKAYLENVDKFDGYVKRAVEIAKIINDLGIQTIPKVPKTNMFLILIPLLPEELRERIKNNKEFNINLGIWEERPKGFSRVEFSVGSSTMKFTDEELIKVFKNLI